MLIDGFVLTGGASRRMGRVKAMLPFGDTTLAGRAFDVLDRFAATVRVVGESVDEIPGVPDVFRCADAGTRASLIGLHSALFHARTEWVAVLACDLPFVDERLFQLLLSVAEGREFDAVIPMQPNGRLQPLTALYKREPCLGVANEMLAANNFRLTDLANRVNIRRVEPDEYAPIDVAGNMFFNINTPDDYAAALAMRESDQNI